MLFLLFGGGVAGRPVGPGFAESSFYVTLLTVAGAGDPDPSQPAWAEILQTVTMLVGVALIPAVTAAVVDSVVRARLALSNGKLRDISGHVIVVGLGNVGTRVVAQLYDLGVPVVAMERNELAPGVEYVRERQVPLVLADATQADTLSYARVDTCRALMVMTSSDVTNLDIGLTGMALRERTGGGRLRVVLRLFDGDLAARVQTELDITSSRSVSLLAAPKFAAGRDEPAGHRHHPDRTGPAAGRRRTDHGGLGVRGTPDPPRTRTEPGARRRSRRRLRRDQLVHAGQLVVDGPVRAEGR